VGWYWHCGRVTALSDRFGPNRVGEGRRAENGGRRWVVLGVLCVTLMLISLDTTVLNVALPAIVRGLSATSAQLEWIVDAYAVVFAGLLLTLGALGDRLGRKWVFTAGLMVFGSGSAFAAFSGSPGQLTAARAVMGVGAAALMPCTIDRHNVFDIELLAGRLGAATGWLRDQPSAGHLPIGYFGASTGAGAALWAAADPAADVAAVVSRGGRPDLAGPRLGQVRAPTLLIVGGRDDVVLELNRQAQARLRCENRLAVVPGATHLFEESGTLASAADLAQQWLHTHLAAAARPVR
jgi:dienelactone hydrolase